MKPQPLREEQLDALLQAYYLNTNSETVDIAEAEFMLQSEQEILLNPEKEKAVIQRLQQQGRGPWWPYMSFGILLTVGFLTFLWMTNGHNDSATTTALSDPPPEVIAPPASASPAVPAASLPQLQPIRILRMPDTFGQPLKLAPLPADSIEPYPAPMPETPTTPVKRPLPVLTKEDQQRYRRVKEQMLTCLLKKDENLYAHIPATKIEYAGEATEIDAFSIRVMGISNLEYKTFLADLLMQEQEEHYWKAQVHSENWALLNYPELAITYFETERYNDFPVVNISPEAANLFCNWLQESLQDYILEHHLKTKGLKIRLPYDEEWIGAAREGYAKIAYDQGYNTIYDREEGLVDKAFSHRAELIKKRVKRIDTLYELMTTNRYGWTEPRIQEFYQKAFLFYSVSPADTIYPQRMKLFGELGRVSEMTASRHKAGLWLTGLSWKDKADYLKLESEFKSLGASPFVGFRIVLVNPNDPAYKYPFW